MLIIFNGVLKDVEYNAAQSLVNRGLAELPTEKENSEKEVKIKKSNKKNKK